MKKLLIFLAMLQTATLLGGTLIYRVGKEEKIISDVEIVAIENNHITLEVGDGKERIHLRNVVKYFDTDIKIGSAFDDGSNDYSVFVRDIKFPASRTGYSGSQKSRVTSEVEISYDIRLAYDGKTSEKKIKVPYFYFYVLTTNEEGSNREIFEYYHPKDAKISFKNYDEALMMEEVLSSARHTQHMDHGRFRQNSMTTWQKLKIKLDGIKDRKIIAVYLIIWGKDKMVYSKGEILDHSYTIPQRWYTDPKR